MACLRRSPEFVAREIAGEMLLVPIAKARSDLTAVLVLEGIGGLVWELLDACHSEAELVAAITAECDVDPETAARDLREYLSDLSQSGAVISCESDAPSPQPSEHA